jgi:hypothetical protein
MLCATAAGATDIGKIHDTMLSTWSHQLFGFSAPISASATATTGAYRSATNQGPLAQIKLAKGLTARYVTRTAANSLDMMVLWPVANPTHIIGFIEGGRSQLTGDADTAAYAAGDKFNPSIQRINLATGQVQTILRGMTACDGIAVTPWGTVLATEETDDGGAYELLTPLATTNYTVKDRATGEIVNTPWMFEYADFRGDVNLETGRPAYVMEKWPFTNVEDRRRYTDADPGRRADGTTVADYTGTEVDWCPGTNARNWQNDAYSPRTGLLYTTTTTDCRTMVVFTQDYTAGEGYTLQRQAGAAVRRTFGGEVITYQTTLQGNSPTEGRTVWKVTNQYNNLMPIMATATDLLFQAGTDEGVMRAYNATNGEEVWEFRTGSRFNQSPITYIGPDGKQYVAIIASSAAANTAVAVDAAADNANRYRRSGSTLYVFALPDAVAAN